MKNSFLVISCVLFYAGNNYAMEAEWIALRQAATDLRNRKDRISEEAYNTEKEKLIQQAKKHKQSLNHIPRDDTELIFDQIDQILDRGDVVAELLAKTEYMTEETYLFAPNKPEEKSNCCCNVQ